MAWIPSRDGRFCRSAANPLWNAMETAYDAACAMASLARRDDVSLDRDYIHVRKGDTGHDVQAMASRLPEVFGRCRLGQTDIDLIDFLLNYCHDRVLNVVGPRGAGKTTLLHYAESVTCRALPGTHPVLFIVDCLPLEDGATRHQFVKRLECELRGSLDSAPPSFHGPLRSALAVLAEDASFQGAGEALVRLLRELPESESCRPIVVVDNLDHLSVSTAELALEMVRAISVGSGVSCITCLRPASLTGVLGRGDAQAFFGLQLSVAPPVIGAWLRSLADRISLLAATADRPAKAASGPVVYGKTLTNEDLRGALLKFTAALQGRRPDDDPIGFLEALSADDMRHLVKLVRRMLSHRDVPWEQFLGISSAGDLHPLPAMFEGQSVWYTGDEFVPNVLFHGCRNGPPDFLLPHRMLTMLNESGPVSPYRLIEWMELLGVDRVDVVTCLDRLYRSLLVRCSDSERIDMSRALPREIWATSAGSHYVNHVFSLADYLLTVIVDVPLRHELLLDAVAKGNVDEVGFRPRLASLLEYTEEVRQAEERQLALLNREIPGSALRRVVDTLRRGGLLSHSLERGLKEIVSRNRSTPWPGIAQAIGDVERVLPRLAAWCAGAEKRLGFILNRASKRDRSALPFTPLTSGEAEVTVQPRFVGDDLSIQVNVRAPALESPLVLLLSGSSGDARFLDAVLPSPKASEWRQAGPAAHGTLRGRVPTVLGAAAGPWEFGGLGVEMGQSPAGKGRGVLVVRDDPDKYIQLVLYLIGDEVAHELGPKLAGETFRRIARRILDGIGERLGLGQDIVDEVAAAGFRLRDEAMTRDGWNLLRAHLGMLDLLLVAARGDNLAVPWEWLCADAEGAPPHVRFVRWPADPLAGALRILQVVDAESSPQSLVTFGLPPDAAWRKPTPSSYKALAAEARADLVHLVAECSGGFLHIDGLRVDEAMVKAFPLLGTRHVVLTACRGAADEEARSFAVAFAARSGTRVWAPLTLVRDDSARKVDLALQTGISAARTAATSMDEILREASDDLPLLRAYVQYALTRN